MEITNELIIHSRKELRQWLEVNHLSEKVAWVVVNRGKYPKDDVIAYLDLVEEVLCFGWIDSTLKKKNQYETLQRITPRTKKSPWSELNIERVRRLRELGLLTKAGEEAVPPKELWSIPNELVSRLKEENAYENFIQFPLVYQKVRLDGIIGLPLDSPTYEKRLEKLLFYTKKKELYGQWNDNGRLHDGPYIK